jgi:hypothetical protein
MNITEFLDRYGVDTTTNFQLLHYAKELNIKPFRVVMTNELKKLKKILDKKVTVYVICNYQTTSEGGTHWCALYRNQGNNYFFDSYGIQPDLEVLDFLGEGVSSTFRIQPVGSRMCGTLSLFTLYRLSKGYNFYDTVLE